MKTQRWDRYKFGVTKPVLLFLAGGLWLCVGGTLLSMAALWLWKAQDVNRIAFAGAGVALALLVHHFGFLKIVNKNLSRILPAEGKRCIFSFMPWKSYLIILIMIAMGTAIRHSSIPKHYLAILYAGIGLALILSATRYAKAFWQETGSHRSSHERTTS